MLSKTSECALNKVAGLWPQIVLKIGCDTGGFFVNFLKFLRIPFLRTPPNDYFCYTTKSFSADMQN